MRLLDLTLITVFTLLTKSALSKKSKASPPAIPNNLDYWAASNHSTATNSQKNKYILVSREVFEGYNEAKKFCNSMFAELYKASENDKTAKGQINGIADYLGNQGFSNHGVIDNRVIRKEMYKKERDQADSEKVEICVVVKKTRWFHQMYPRLFSVDKIVDCKKIKSHAICERDQFIPQRAVTSIQNVQSRAMINGYEIPTCDDGCLSDRTCEPLECAPDFHQCECEYGMSSTVMYDEYGTLTYDNYGNQVTEPIYSDTGSLTYYSYYCDAEECNASEHYCQRYACDTTYFPQEYYECHYGCLNEYTCDPNVCAPEFGECNCDNDDCDMDWCWREVDDGYCDQNVCRNKEGDIIKNEQEPMPAIVVLIVVLIQFSWMSCCCCCCCCCGAPFKSKNPPVPTVNTQVIQQAGPPVYPTQMQAAPAPPPPQPMMQPIMQPMMQPMMAPMMPMQPMMQPMMQAPQQAAPINITIANNNDNKN